MKNFILRHSRGLSILAVLILVLLFVTAFMIEDCHYYGVNMKAQTEFTFFGGGNNSCLVKINNVWIPTDKWILNVGN